MIAKTRNADALVTSASPVTRGVMSALEGLKVVARTGVGYDVIDVPAATELGVIVVNIPDLWVREVANHALALLLAWNRAPSAAPADDPVRYCFTAPNVRPVTMWRCASRATRSTGRVMSVAAAASVPQLISS
jgi:hypothetical protein